MTASLSPDLTVRGLLVNGWQNITETNEDKAVGSQVQYKASESVLLNWSTFVGNEAPDSVDSRLRVFNDLYVVFTLSPSWSIALVADIGMQEKASGDSFDLWHGASFMARWIVSEKWALGGRAEYFADKYGLIVPTGAPGNFQTMSASANIDLMIVPNFLWRIEGRFFRSRDPIYPSDTGLKETDGFIAVSAAVSL